MPQGYRASLDAAVAACAPAVRGESHGAVMAGAAVFTLGEGFHGEVRISLGFQCLHFKSPCMAHVAGQSFLLHVDFMGKLHRLDGLAIKDVAAVLLALAGTAGAGKVERHKDGCYDDS